MDIKNVASLALVGTLLLTVLLTVDRIDNALSVTAVVDLPIRKSERDGVRLRPPPDALPIGRDDNGESGMSDRMQRGLGQ